MTASFRGNSGSLQEAEVLRLIAFIRKSLVNERVILFAYTLLFAFAGLVIGQKATQPGMIRLLFFIAFAMLLIAFYMKQPRLVLFSLVMYLPFMSFFRRMLIPAAGWSSFDPLIILPSFIILLMGFSWAYRIYLSRVSLIEDDTKLFRLVRWLLIVHMVQVFNPIQGGILAGFGGVIFYVVPLLWMIMTRLYINNQWMKAIYGTVFIIGIASALYGLKQAFYGFLDFENDWIRISGYAALIVGNGSRSFSFLTSAAEYSQYMVACVIIAWAYILRGKLLMKLMGAAALPLFFYALFMVGSRGPVILTTLGLTVMSLMAARGKWMKLMVAGTAVVAIVGGFTVISQLDHGSNAIIAHQVNGLTNPFDEKSSTLSLHIDMVIHGFVQGLKFPIGRGLGSTTLAGAKMGGSGENSELDITNVLISDGVIGGAIYFLLIMQILRMAFRLQMTGTVPLTILGLLVATAGTWSIGGNYSTCALIWLSIGYLDRLMKQDQYNKLVKGNACEHSP
jgi:hypothetical protein